jgi:hypothetical protein
MPIEGLAQVRVATRACKQIVPLRLEGIETGAIAHDGECDGRRPDVRPAAGVGRRLDWHVGSARSVPIRGRWRR